MLFMLTGCIFPRVKERKLISPTGVSSVSGVNVARNDGSSRLTSRLCRKRDIPTGRDPGALNPPAPTVPLTQNVT